MLRHPVGVLSLVLMMLAAATVAGGVVEGTWGLEHVRGLSILPAFITAMLIIVIAGPRRGVVAFVAEVTAILCVLWALNHVRLMIKWHGDGMRFEQTLSLLQAAGLVLAAALLVRSRPPAEEADWHRGSAMVGAGLWLTGLRTGPGSRGALGLSAAVFMGALFVGTFEKARRSPAAARLVSPFVDEQAWSGARDESRPSSSSSPSNLQWSAEPPGRSDDPESASEREPEDAETESTPPDGPGTSGWYVPAPERRLPPGRAAPRHRSPAERIQTRISHADQGRRGPWAGVLSDRPLLRMTDPGPAGATQLPSEPPPVASARPGPPASPPAPGPAGMRHEDGIRVTPKTMVVAPPGPLSLVMMGPFEERDEDVAGASPTPAAPSAAERSASASTAPSASVAAALAAATIRPMRDEPRTASAVVIDDRRPGWSRLVGFGARVEPGRPTAITTPRHSPRVKASSPAAVPAPDAPAVSAASVTTPTPAPATASSPPQAAPDAGPSWARMDRIAAPTSVSPVATDRPASPPPGTPRTSSPVPPPTAAAAGWTRIGSSEPAAAAAVAATAGAPTATRPPSAVTPLVSSPPLPSFSSPSAGAPAASAGASRPANTAWTDPQIALAADAGAAEVSRRSPLLLAGIGGGAILVLSLLARGLGAGTRTGARPATGTTGTP